MDAAAMTTTLSASLPPPPHHHLPAISLPLLLKPPPPSLSSISISNPNPKPKPQLHSKPQLQSQPKTSSNSSSPLPPSRGTAAAGYAAALADATRRAGTLLAAAFHAQILARLISTASDEAALAAAKTAGFDARLVALVGMLVRKGKGSLVGEVLVEFGRICDELMGTTTVVVPAAGSQQDRGMGPAQLKRIAEQVGRRSGASRVRIVRRAVAGAGAM